MQSAARPRKSIFGLHHQMSESKLQETINKHGIIACSSRFSHCFGYAHQADCCHSDGKLISVPHAAFPFSFPALCGMMGDI
jgi:hypothetical protein